MNNKDIFEMFPGTPNIIKYNLCYFSLKYAHMLTSNKHINTFNMLKYSSEGNVRMIKLILPFYYDITNLSKCLAQAVINNHIEIVEIILNDDRISTHEKCTFLIVCYDHCYNYIIDKSKPGDIFVYSSGMLQLILDSFPLEKLRSKEENDILIEMVKSILQSRSSDIVSLILQFAKKHKLVIPFRNITYTMENIDILSSFFLSSHEHNKDEDMINMLSNKASEFNKVNVLSKFILNDEVRRCVNLKRCLSTASNFNSTDCIQFLLQNIHDVYIINKVLCDICTVNVYPYTNEMWSKTIDIYMEDGRITSDTINRIISCDPYTQGYTFKFAHMMKYYNFNDNNFTIIDNYFDRISLKINNIQKSKILYKNLIFNVSVNINKLRDHFKSTKSNKKLQAFNLIYKQLREHNPLYFRKRK